MKAFTYLVINNINKKWYYGVRYAKNCKITDILNTYTTSSKYVNEDIIKYGINNFSYEIRKTFNNVDDALKWEIKVLRRMKIHYNTQCYNVSINKGFPIMSGESNPSKRPEVREKLKISALNRKPQTKDTINKATQTRTKNRIIKLFKSRNFKINKNLAKSYKKQLDYMIKYHPYSKFIIKKLEYLIENCLHYKKKYSTINRNGIKRGTIPKISLAKSGSKWYTSPDLSKMVYVKEGCAPNGWIPGMKKISRIEKARKNSIGRKHTEASKLIMSEKAKSKIYFTSPDLSTLKVVYDINDVPEGWIRGNKLKSRMDKLCKKKDIS